MITPNEASTYLISLQFEVLMVGSSGSGKLELLSQSNPALI